MYSIFGPANLFEPIPPKVIHRFGFAKDVMVELDLKKLTAPDFTASIRPGTPAPEQTTGTKTPD
jgi:hypothetical protein